MASLKDRILQSFNNLRAKTLQVGTPVRNFLSTPIANLPSPYKQPAQVSAKLLQSFYNTRNPVVSIPRAIGSDVNKYSRNVILESAKDVPRAIGGIVNPQPFDIGGYQTKPWQSRAVNVGRLGLDVLGAIPDPSDPIFAGYNYLKGARSSYLKGGTPMQNIQAGRQSATYEKPVGLGEALTKNETGQMIGNLAEIPAILAFAGVRSKGAKDFAKIVNKTDDIAEVRRLSKNFEYLDDAVQMEMFSKVKKLGNEFIPGVVKSKEMKRLAATDPVKWARTVSVYLDDVLINAKKSRGIPKIGFTARQIEKVEDVGIVGKQPKGVGGVKAKVVEQTFKTDKFNLSKQNTKTLDKLRKTLGFENRNVRSFNDMKAMAEDLGTDPDRIIKDVQSGRINDKEVIALGNVISTSSQRISKLTTQLKKTPGDANLLRQLDAEELLLNKAISKRIRGGTEAGRSVAAFRIIANKNLDPTYWLGKAQKQLGDARQLKAEEITAVNNLIKNKDRLGLAKFVSLLGESTLREKVLGLWKAGLLTSFRTHEANIISNTAFGALETVKDIPATAFDIARSAITGQPRAKTFGTKSVTQQIPGAVEGVKQAKQYLTEGVDVRDIGKLDTYKPLRFGESTLGKAAQKYTNAIFGALGGEDKVFREMAVQRSLADQAGVVAINKKLTVDQLEELIKNPTKEMLEQAVNDAKYATFNNPNVISDAIRNAKKVSPGVATVIDFIAPFTRTPTNVLKAVVDYTPVGIVSTVVKKLSSGGSVSDKQLAEAFGRSTTGIALIWAGYKLAEQGKIQGASPKSEAERSQMYLEGRQPNSILVNGKWRKVDRISPLGNLFVLGAEYYNSGKDLAQTAAAGVKSLKEQSFLKGVSQALSAIDQPGTGARKYVESAISGFVPNLSKDVARGGDDYLRETNNITQTLKSGIPGLRETLPIRLDALGNPIKQEGGYGTALLDPSNPKTATNDPIILEMKRVGYNLNVVGDTLNKEKLTPAQNREYQRLAGQNIKKYLPPVINSSAYKTADIDTQKSIIEKAVNKSKDLARNQIKPYISTIKEKSGVGVQASEQLSQQNQEIGVGNGITDTYTYINDEGLIKTINIGKVTSMPSTNSYQKVIKQKEAYKLVDDILDNLPQQEQNQALQKLGITRNEADYYNVARNDNDAKYAFVLDQIKQSNSPIKDLVYMRREVNGDMILANGVIDQLYDDGYISNDQKKYLKALKYEEGQVSIDRDYKPSGGKKKTISDAQLLSAYKKALEAAYAPRKSTVISHPLNIIQPLKLKRQEIRPLR